MKATIMPLLCALLIFITLPAKAAGSCGSGAEMLTVDEILNRRSSPEWPDIVQGVIYQKGQYADWTLRHIPTVKVSGRVIALALKLATCGTMDAEIIFQSMHPELGKVKYHVDTEYFATKK